MVEDEYLKPVIHVNLHQKLLKLIKKVTKLKRLTNYNPVKTNLKDQDIIR